MPTDEYYLANDIDFTNFAWDYDTTFNNVIFRGVLNGNNKILSNLTITNNLATSLNTSIFPRSEGGRIFNLTLDNVHIKVMIGGPNSRAGLLIGTVRGGGGRSCEFYWDSFKC